MFIHVNGQLTEVNDDLALEEMLRNYHIDPQTPGVAVAINQRVIGRSSWSQHKIKPDDCLEVIYAVQGG